MQRQLLSMYLICLFLFYLWHTKEKNRNRKNSQLVKYLTLSKVMYRSGHKYMNALHRSFWFALSCSENGDVLNKLLLSL